jgi:hypothetical protein
MRDLDRFVDLQVLDVYHPTITQVASSAGASAVNSRVSSQASRERSIVIMPLQQMSASELLSLEHDDGCADVGDMESACIAVCSLAAMAALNMAGYGHCDIKPDNIMINMVNDLTQVRL